MAGEFSRHTIPVFWDRLETVVWLDFPLRTRSAAPDPEERDRGGVRHKNGLPVGREARNNYRQRLGAWSLDSLIGYSLRRGRV